MRRRIAIFHYKVGGTDGVSLEIDKIKRVLEALGHAVYLCAGNLGTPDGTLIEALFHHIPSIERLTRNTFTQLTDYDEAGYGVELQTWVEILEAELRKFILEKKIDFIIVQNVWSVALNPAAAIALEHVRYEFQLPAIAHSHDFYFERPGIALTCPAALELADRYLPPRNPAIQHLVINSLSQKSLLERKGIQAEILPNVFDFDVPPWAEDDFNRDFRQNIGLEDNDILVLQATRIVPRKGIELAIDFVKALDSPERRSQLTSRGLYNNRTFTPQSCIVLVMAGYTQDDATGRYKDLLVEKAQKLGVETLFIGDQIAEGRQIGSGQKIYSLWDTYVFADFITYPSLWEGWGNQLLEAIRAKCPVLLFKYPVYQADLKQLGLKVVSLGSQTTGQDEAGLVTINPQAIQAAANQALTYLTDPQLRSAATEHNFNIARKYYSINTLRTHLNRLVS